MYSNTFLKSSSVALCFTLAACGGSSSEDVIEKIEEVIEEKDTNPVQGQIFGPHSTGSVSAPEFVYFDLETQSVVEITGDAADNNVWDIAFKRSGVYLNQHAENTVKSYSTGHNSDFFDSEGTAINDSFINTSAELELPAYLAVTTADAPSDEAMYVADVTSNIIEGFYNYNSTTHVISPADEHYFIVNSDDAFSKFRVTDITTQGRYIGSITFATGYQGASDSAFGSEQTLTVDTALACTADVTAVYVDFDTNQEVTAADEWDIMLPCNTTEKAAEFAIHIAEDAQAFQDFDNNYTEISPTAVAYYGFQQDEYSVKAFDATPWYQYGLNGGHLLWSQFDIYLIKTSTATYKFQMTSYYNEEGTSGHISFRADELTELAGVAE